MTQTGPTPGNIPAPVSPMRLKVARLNRCFIPQANESITGTFAVRAFLIAVISGCLTVRTFAPIKCSGS